VALVFKGGVNTRLYINGIEDLGGDFPAAHAAVGEIKAGFDHTIGNDDQSIAKGAQGIIDNVSVYNRALTASEVSQLYREPFRFVGRKSRRIMFDEIAGVPPAGKPYYYREIASRRIA